MEYEIVCQIAAIEEEGFFQCENINEWFVQLNNYFHYELDFGNFVSRSLYQTAEIRVYVDGWEPNMAPGSGGTIKVVQLPPIISFGSAGRWEKILDKIPFTNVTKRVEAGLASQYEGRVAKMLHIIDTDRLSGASATSLGIDGDASTPLNERNIIWDIPQTPVVEP